MKILIFYFSDYKINNSEFSKDFNKNDSQRLSYLQSTRMRVGVFYIDATIHLLISGL